MIEQQPTYLFVALGYRKDSDGAHRVLFLGVFERYDVAKEILEREGFTRETWNIITCLQDCAFFIPAFRIEPENHQ